MNDTSPVRPMVGSRIMSFALTLAPPFLYMGWIYRSIGRPPLYAGVLVPLLVLLCVGGASYVLNGLKRTGLRAKVMALREEPGHHKDEHYLAKVYDKIGSTLTTLTMLGSLTFAMVIFALPLLFLTDGQLDSIAVWRAGVFGEQRALIAMARPTFVFIVFLLAITSLLLLVSIDAYDTARDPVWDENDLNSIRRFTRGTYYLGLLNLVYTVLFAALVIHPVVSIFGAVAFLVSVLLYDSSVQYRSGR